MPPSLTALVLAALLVQAPQPSTVPPSAADAESLVARGDWEGAAAAYAALLQDPQSDRARTLYRLATVEHRLGRAEAAVDHARQAATLLSRAARPADAADAWNLVAMAEFGRSGCPRGRPTGGDTPNR
jgi:tetratricopeptide (TPR) repeat protein